jgi:type II secretory pathway pseudopilin PulG
MKKSQGITLLEIMLVLAVASSLFLIGLRVYQQFKQQRISAEIKANADTLMQGMARYYQAYCRSGGKLNSTAASVAINITDDLINKGFIDATWQMPSPIVASYVTQFNSFFATRYVSANANWPNPPDALTAKPIMRSSSVLIWKIQVAAKINDRKNIDTYRSLTGATCISSLAGEIVNPCTTSSKTGDYLVWERLPSYASPESKSPLWPSIARSKQFNQDYTNDDFYALNTDDSTWDVSTQYEVYLCGG